VPGPRSLAELAPAPGQDPALLADLARSGGVEVRAALATNRQLPSELATRLAKDRSIQVRRALAASGCTTRTVVERLAEDRAVTVRSALLDAFTDRYRWFGAEADEP
jgi:hypothetical protein